MKLNKYSLDNFSSSSFLNENSLDNISIISGFSVEKSIMDFDSFFSINVNKIDFPFIKVNFEKEKIKNESNKKSNKEIPIFTTKFRNKKRGRSNKSNKKRKDHCSSSSYNIMRKIQTHFSNFSISFINDSIKSYFGKQNINF